MSDGDRVVVVVVGWSHHLACLSWMSCGGLCHELWQSPLLMMVLMIYFSRLHDM